MAIQAIATLTQSITITIGGNRRSDVCDTSATWISGEENPAVDADGVRPRNTKCTFTCWLLLVPIVLEVFSLHPGWCWQAVVGPVSSRRLEGLEVEGWFTAEV